MQARNRRLIGAGAAVVAVVVIVAALQGGDDEPERAPLLPTSTRADLSGVELGGVEGTTTTTEPSVDGRVNFSGTVRTETGETLPRATVRAEWFHQAGSVVVETTTGRRGRWRIENVAGGRWQIRAFRAPDYATGEPEEVFVGHDERREFDLPVRFVPEITVTWDVEPDPPIVDRNTQLAVVFFEQSVDLDGTTVTTPLSRIDVEFIGPQWERVRGDEIEPTDGGGRVEWTIRCLRSGQQTVRVVSGSVEEVLDVPACIPLSATSTTSTVAPPSTASTTADTTTTTES